MNHGEKGSGLPMLPLVAAPRYLTAGMPTSRKAYQPSGMRHRVIRLKKLTKPLAP
jgi:hypothetical protein